MSDKEEKTGIQKTFAAARYILGPLVRYLVLMIVVESILAVLLVLTYRLPAIHFLYEWLSANGSVLGMLCISLPALWIFFRMYRRDRCGYITDYGGRKQLPAMISLIACAFCMAVSLNVFILLTPLQEMFPQFTETNEAMHRGMEWLVALYSVLIAPITEEVLFRGVIYRRIRKLFGVRFAIVLSSIIFGLFHGNMVQFIYAFLVGLALAFVYERYGTLKAPMLFHIIANASSACAAPLLESPASMPAAVILLLASCLCLWNIDKKVQPPVEKRITLETEIGENE